MPTAAAACPSATWNPITKTSSFSAHDREILTHHWHPVAFSAEVAVKPYAVTLLDEPIVLYRTGSKLNAARDICSHRGAPLSKGWVQGENIICPTTGCTSAPMAAAPASRRNTTPT